MSSRAGTKTPVSCKPLLSARRAIAPASPSIRLHVQNWDAPAGSHHLLSAYCVPGTCSELYVSYLSSPLPHSQRGSVLLLPCFLHEEIEAQERSIVAPGP